MFKALMALLGSGFTLSGFGKFMTFALVVLSLAMGVGLALTVSERNSISKALDSANATLKETRVEADKKQRALEAAEQSFEGCSASLMKLNQHTQEQAEQAAQMQAAGDASAERHLASLSASINSDRATAATPEQTTRWLQELFK